MEQDRLEHLHVSSSSSITDNDRQGDNPQERLFLESRLERTNDKDRMEAVATRNKKREAIHAFWATLRRRLTNWEQRLISLEKEFEANNEMANPKSDSDNKRQKVRDGLEWLRYDLDQWRRQCLSMSNSMPNFIRHGRTEAPEEGGEEVWNVPEDIPTTDLKLLHSEFTKYNARLEATQDRLFPKGKFVFRRYREALARRNIQQEDMAKQQQQLQGEKGNPRNADSSKKSSKNSTRDPRGAAVLEHLKNSNLVITKDGTVQRILASPEDDSQISQQSLKRQDAGGDRDQITTANVEQLCQLSLPSILIRNLQHCTLTM